MPYIKQTLRANLDNTCVGTVSPMSREQLTYVLLRVCMNYSENSEGLFQDAVSSLESVKAELYRKHIGPNAAQAAFEHGAVE